MIVQLVKILSALCRTRRRIILCTGSGFRTTYFTGRIHSTPSQSTTLRFILILSSYLVPGLVTVSSFHTFHFSFHALNVFVVLATCSTPFSFVRFAVPLYLIEAANYEIYNYVIFFFPLLLSQLYIQILNSATFLKLRMYAA